MSVAAVNAAEKAMIFKEQTAKLLTRPESDAIKAALASFTKSKDIDVLVESLNGLLVTPKKREMYDAVGLFIPKSQIGRYTELVTLMKGGQNSPVAESSEPQAAEPTIASSATAPRRAGTSQLEQFKLVSIPPLSKLTTADKAEIFKEYTAKLLTRTESDSVKKALATFTSSKDTASLVETLQSLFTTTEKARMYDAVGMFIPKSQSNEYVSMISHLRSGASVAEGEDVLAPTAGPDRSPTVPIGADPEDAASMRSRKGSVLSQKGLVRRASKLVIDSLNPKETSLATKLKLAEAEAGRKQNGKIVIYTTTGGGIQETKMSCDKMRMAFQLLRVPFEEKNVYMSTAFAEELKERLPGATVPQCFFNGNHLGDYESILRLNEIGKLSEMTADMERKVPTEGCDVCGGEGFIICQKCGGGKKSVRLRYGSTSGKGTMDHALKCMACNENGLMPCPKCISC